MDNKKVFEENIYDKTKESIDDVVGSFPTYTEILKCFNSGENSFELKKRFMLKKLDEVWIEAIENCIPALDAIIRNPQYRLTDLEEILPVQISKHINGRSVVHLSQNTNLITEVKDDGTVIPSKLLNVSSEDTLLTYENKFINTLVNRLSAFVTIRYNGAKECGEDEKNTSFTLTQNFEHQEYNGKIKLSIEVRQKPEEHEVIKNYIYTSDLWKRMVKINDILNEYMSSSFIKTMGRNYIKSPVLRTNTILKNPLFRDCLSLWEFIETYENTGYETLVQEDLLTASDELIQEIYNSVSEQYLIFQEHIQNGFEDEMPLDSRVFNVKPTIKDQFDELNENEFNFETKVPGVLKNEGLIDVSNDELDLAIRVALAADDMLWHDELEEVIPEEDKSYQYKYKYSFLARLIRAQNPTQDFYNEIKNELLSYNKVKSYLSWSRELFKQGRKRCAKLNCKGKTLYVYLPLDPREFDENKYHHLDVTKENGKNEYPFLLKVRSNRACKYAKELIAIVMERLGIMKNEAYIPQDFHMSPMSIEELLDKDLARLIDGTYERKPKTDVEIDEENSIAYMYKFSYSARLIRSGDERQELYSLMKNEVMKYKGVKNRISWGHESFKYGQNKVSLFKVKGKTLCVYLPLNPDDYDQEHYHFVDLRNDEKEVELPLMMKITSLRSVKYTAELLKDVMAKFDIQINDLYLDQDYKLPFMSIDEMLVSDPVLAKRIDGYKPEVIKPEPIVEDEDDINYMYKFSYSARLIRSGDERQEWYNALKNNLLSYKKVTSKISWGHELFKNGRNKISIFKVKGKTLGVYLPLNPDDYDQEHYHFVDLRNDEKDVEMPLMMKITSDRAVKYTIELIKDVMIKFELNSNDSYIDQDYKLPFMSIDEMLVSDPVLAKRIDGFKPEVAVKPEPEIVETVDEEDEDGINYMYKFSYSARLIRSGDERQEFYNLLKNHFLSYKKVTSKISWGHELFKIGRNKLSLFKVKGKTLCVYLPLNPDNYDMERMHFKDMRNEDEDVEYPLMLKITSMRSVKYACELFDSLMGINNIIKNDSYLSCDYKLPFMTIDEMLVSDPVLAKRIDGFKPEIIIKPQSEIIETSEIIEDETTDDDELEEVINGINYKYKFSFSARLIRSGKERQELYNTVKNNILSYKKVTSKISWGHELFKLGRKKCALLKVKGKTLCVYLPLNPDNYDADHYHFKDVRVEGKEVEFPLMMKITSERAAKYTAQLLSDVMNAFDINKDDSYIEKNYKLKYMSISKMLSCEPALAKLIEKKVSYESKENDNEPLQNSIENKKISMEEPVSIEKHTEIFEEAKETVLEENAPYEEKADLMVGEPKEPLNDEAILRENTTELPVEPEGELLQENSVDLLTEPAEEIVDVNLDDETFEEESEELNDSYDENNDMDDEIAGVGSKLKLSFLAHLVLSGEEKQELYNVIKNNTLSFKKVTSKIYWGREAFKNGRNKIALFKIRGKTLSVYLPLNPDNYDANHYHFKDLRIKGKEVEFPMMIKITSSRAAKYANDLIGEVIKNIGLVKNDKYESANYKMPNYSIAEMFELNPPLIKKTNSVVLYKTTFKDEQPIQNHTIAEKQPEEKLINNIPVNENTIEEKTNDKEAILTDQKVISDDKNKESFFDKFINSLTRNKDK